VSELGCGDHGCVVQKPKGMGTNGGCRCFDNTKLYNLFVKYKYGHEKLERELTALRSEQMTEAKAREVLGDWIDGWTLYKEDIINWPLEYYENEVRLSSDFTSLQLRAIAWWMDNMGWIRKGPIKSCPLGSALMGSFHLIHLKTLNT
jgi:hypothetical protein